MSSGLVLDDSTEIQRVAIVTHRAIGDGLSAVVHIAYSDVYKRQKLRTLDLDGCDDLSFLDLNTNPKLSELHCLCKSLKRLEPVSYTHRDVYKRQPKNAGFL